jgi:hypothetical protein
VTPSPEEDVDTLVDASAWLLLPLLVARGETFSVEEMSLELFFCMDIYIPPPKRARIKSRRIILNIV